MLMHIRAAQRRESIHTNTTLNPGPTTDWISNVVAVCRRQPLTILLIAGYGIAMVHLMTWFYIEIVTWYDSVLDDNLLNNFSLRHYFIKETMRRNDFRFFPLAHQDLHLLSWFTPYVKVWAIVSLVELIAIVVLCCRFIRRLTQKAAPSLLLMATLLMLFQPSTATAFFQLIYSERILTLLLIGYAVSYLAYQEKQQESTFLITLLLATLGIFFKDIAPIMFILPAIFILILGLAGRIKGKPSYRELTSNTFYKHYRLELWLAGVGVIFIGCFTILSLIPSLYEGDNAFREHEKIFEIGTRYIGLLAFISIRFGRIIRKQNQGNLLDALNFSALFYSIAVYAFKGFRDGSYLALPVQMIVVLDTLYAWTIWVSPYLSKRMRENSVGLIGSTACTLLIGSDFFQKENFFSTVHDVSQKQVIWENAYNSTRRRLKTARSNGEEINLIFTDSWFTRKRHLDKLPFNRLVYLDPGKNTYIVQDGEGTGKAYTPQSGDFLINIDRENIDELVHDLDQYKKIYSAKKDSRAGTLYRRK